MASSSASRLKTEQGVPGADALACGVLAAVAVASGTASAAPPSSAAPAVPSAGTTGAAASVPAAAAADASVSAAAAAAAAAHLLHWMHPFGLRRHLEHPKTGAPCATGAFGIGHPATFVFTRKRRSFAAGASGPKSTRFGVPGAKSCHSIQESCGNGMYTRL